MNVLEDVAWIKTETGLKTPRECFEDPLVQLRKDVFGYEYGAQFRFLMTIFPLLVSHEPQRSSKGRFSQETIDFVFETLEPFADVHGDRNGFLQISEVDLPSVVFAGANPASKLIPHTQAPDDKQSSFWDFSRVAQRFALEEAVMALVSYYFYGPGTNTALLKGGLYKLSNGSSALQYTGDGPSAAEIIPQGESLLDSLRLNTPKSWITPGEVQLPHWAERKSNASNIHRSSWKFSWSANTVKLHWDEEGFLTQVTRGGIPKEWSEHIPKKDEKDFGKAYHGDRQVLDPLYPYRTNKDGEVKLERIAIGSDPVYSIIQWHSNGVEKYLTEKWSEHLLSKEALENLVFLEHKTGGTAQSFSLRHSKVIVGYKDEFFPGDPLVQAQLFQRFDDVLTMRKRLMGMFTENGTMKHLAFRREAVEVALWNELQELTLRVLKEPLAEEEWRKGLTKSALAAFELISSNRNTIYIKQHLAATRIIQGVFYNGEN